jgi:hypothetical protein
MGNIVGSGFTTKAEFEQFIRTTPIPSIEGESVVQCAAVGMAQIRLGRQHDASQRH